MADDRYLTLECVDCLKEFEFVHNRDLCPYCGSGWLRPVFDYERLAPRSDKIFDGNIGSLWKYFDLLPIRDRGNIVSMGEGGTPLVRSRMSDQLGIELYLKDEGAKPPTYTFKDRGATLAISALKEAGIREVVVYSTGNIGVAYSCYCQAAGIRVHVFSPSNVEDEKRQLIESFGATLHLVDGTYDDSKQAAKEYSARKGIFLDRGVMSFYRIASKKTVGFEVFEQLGMQAPDWIFQAVSGGIGPMGLWVAFTELNHLRLMRGWPRIGCIQASGCDPMYQSFIRDSREITNVDKPTTSILTIATGYPVAYPHLYNVVKKSGGTFTTVEDHEAYSMRERLVDDGIWAGAASAATIAGIKKLVEQGFFATGQRVVGIVTGRR